MEKPAEPEFLCSDESGSAVIEFLMTTIVLILPTVYLILTFAAVQSATYAAESSAREVGRIYSRALSDTEATKHAHITTQLAFADHGIAIDPADAVTVSCSATPCVTPGSMVHIDIRATVTLPLVPDVIAARIPASVTVSADNFSTIDRFQEHQ